jgi:tRNA threonylcarbamoyladenosine biosynthesis protein TsaB
VNGATLAIEASARCATVALGSASGEVFVAAIEQARGAARGLAPAIDSVLRRAGLTAADLGAIAVGRGPGGYTGARLAIATARALAFARRVPLVGIDSTAALACDPRVPAGEIVVALDARHATVYVARYRKDGAGGLAEIAPPVVAPAVEVAAGLSAAEFVAGDGFAAISRAAASPPRGCAEVEADARYVLALALRRLARGERDDDSSVLPHYLRKSEAERLFEARRAARG